MKETEENVDWAIQKLARFKGWIGFPEDSVAVESRARCFVRLVHNQTVREIMERPREIRAQQGFPPEPYRLDPELNDADWILSTIEETLEFFPLPVQMRRLYATKLPPASDVEEID